MNLQSIRPRQPPDCLQQTVNGVPTTYAVDMAGGLTQVISDGTNAYLYGVNRISQQHDSTTEYYLDDALGSVRQLTNATGEVVDAGFFLFTLQNNQVIWIYNISIDIWFNLCDTWF